MAHKKTAEKGLSITWSINNFSYCWQKTGEALASPAFLVHESERNKCKLKLFPRGRNNESYITLCLCDEMDLYNEINAKFTIEFLASDGSILSDHVNSCNIVSKTRAVIAEDSNYLPQDILTLRCRLPSECEASEVQQIFARTIINIEKISFLWSVKNFSNLTLYEPQSFEVKSTFNDPVMRINLSLTSDDEGYITLNISIFDRNIKYFTIKSFILDCTKNKVDSGENKCWPDNGKCPTFALQFTKSKLMNNKSLYLPNDELTLSFDLTISRGLAFDGIENTTTGYTLLPLSNEVVENWKKCIAHEKMFDCPCKLIADLTTLQKDQSTCDMKIKTKTNVFPVHTLILSARSPVFKAMFSSEMKETINGCVNIFDLDDETLRQFLLYMYTDQLADFKWENALQMYTTADKYAVISLKEKCSDFMKNNLQMENVCEVLELSDLHNAKDLKVAAQNYILKNTKEVLKTEKWKLLVDTHPKLAVETISRNWIED